MNIIKGEDVHFLGEHPMFKEPEFEARVKVEAKKAANGPYSKYGLNGEIETEEKKIKNTRTGHRAEWYLIKEHNFKDDVGVCCDVFSPKGTEVEVKCSAGSPHSHNGKEWRKDQIKKATKQFLDKTHQAKLVYLFGHNRHLKGHPYKFEATYRWSDEKRTYIFESNDMIL